MKKAEVKNLPLGLYRLHWKKSCGGGSSLAAVGMKVDGGRWMAPINWATPTMDDKEWRFVDFAEHIG